jgi:hypothetical protein
MEVIDTPSGYSSVVIYYNVHSMIDSIWTFSNISDKNNVNVGVMLQLLSITTYG